MTIQNPSESFYPAAEGPNVAKQLANRVKTYEQLIAALDAELEAAERAFAEAFVRDDVVQTARDRITALSNRKTAGTPTNDFR